MTVYSLFHYNADPSAYARMAESADATDLKSVGELNPCASSSLAPGIFNQKGLYQFIAKEFNK